MVSTPSALTMRSVRVTTRPLRSSRILTTRVPSRVNTVRRRPWARAERSDTERLTDSESILSTGVVLTGATIGAAVTTCAGAGAGAGAGDGVEVSAGAEAGAAAGAVVPPAGAVVGAGAGAGAGAAMPVKTLPISAKVSCWAPPAGRPGPSTRKKLVPSGLPVTGTSVTASPMKPAGGAGAPGAAGRDGPPTAAPGAADETGGRGRGAGRGGKERPVAAGHGVSEIARADRRDRAADVDRGAPTPAGGRDDDSVRAVRMGDVVRAGRSAVELDAHAVE